MLSTENAHTAIVHLATDAYVGNMMRESNKLGTYPLNFRRHTSFFTIVLAETRLISSYWFLRPCQSHRVA